jgi:hypothetical protein
LLSAFFARFQANSGGNPQLFNPLISRQLENGLFSAKNLSIGKLLVFN